LGVGAVGEGRLACRKPCDYSDHMTATLREAKARLSEMVKRASRGEEVVITVHGKETARLVAVPEQRNKIDKEKWLRELDKLRKENWTGRYGKSAQEIQDEDRADRF
jgi:prevent-host-death family protein